MTDDFELDGLRLIALNGGHEFTPDEAISFGINSMLQMRTIDLDALEDAVARAPRQDGSTGFRNGLLQDGVTR